jgi:hypothetical protein
MVIQHIHNNDMGISYLCGMSTWHAFLYLTPLLLSSHMNGSFISLFSRSTLACSTPQLSTGCSRHERRGKQGEERIYSWGKRKREVNMADIVIWTGVPLKKYVTPSTWLTWTVVHHSTNLGTQKYLFKTCRPKWHMLTSLKANGAFNSLFLF